MKSPFLSLFLCATCIVNAQNFNWSVEANYPISIGDELGNDNPGIVDLGLKYRFLEIGFARLGAVINAGFFRDDLRTFADGETFDFDETNWLIQPKVFMEFKIPALEKLRPSIGLGYTIITSKFEGDFPGLGRGVSDTSTDGGININLGLSYDITKRFFIQAQYDYIQNNIDNPGLSDIEQDLGFLKFGAGFCF
ncbi:outer membrane beta-barrel protein [Allomuricauda sp. R78024]|uniref:outer membrane beta-barrel protein n=1 Tax=Allomuricauda sp. R78024 TaxID=3093867 RepID=UPI0037C9E6F0